MQRYTLQLPCNEELKTRLPKVLRSAHIIFICILKHHPPPLRQTCIMIKDDLAMGDLLGEGSFGKVTAAMCCGVQVAVKTLKVSVLPESELANFR